MEKLFDIRRFIFCLVYFVNDESNDTLNDLWEILHSFNGGDLIRNQGKTLAKYIEDEGNECFISKIYSSCGYEYVMSLGFVKPSEYQELSLSEAIDCLNEVQKIMTSRRAMHSTYKKYRRSYRYYQKRVGRIDKLKRYLRTYTAAWTNHGSKIVYISKNDIKRRFGYSDSEIKKSFSELEALGINFVVDDHEDDTYIYRII